MIMRRLKDIIKKKFPPLYYILITLNKSHGNLVDRTIAKYVCDTINNEKKYIIDIEGAHTHTGTYACN